MDPDLLNLNKEVDAIDVIRMLLDLNPDDREKLYYIMTGLQISKNK